MNFKDAAIKILEEQKKPLHYKKIATLAIKYKLLEHPGSNPAKRMLEVLKLESKKKNKLVITIKPGFFILKKFSFKKNNRENLVSKSKKKKSLNSQWLEIDENSNKISQEKAETRHALSQQKEKKKEKAETIDALSQQKEKKDIKETSFADMMEMEGVISSKEKKEKKAETRHALSQQKEKKKEKAETIDALSQQKEEKKAETRHALSQQKEKKKEKKAETRHALSQQKNESLLDKKIKNNEKKFKVKMLHNLAAESTIDLKELINLIKKMDIEKFSFSIKELKSSTLINQDDQKIIKTEIEKFQKSIIKLQEIKEASIKKEENIKKIEINLKKDDSKEETIKEIDVENEIINISDFSKQIYSKSYFSEDYSNKKNSNKESSNKKTEDIETNKEEETPQKVNSVNKKREVKKENLSNKDLSSNQKKFDIPKELLKKLIEKKEIKYYSILELKKIVENMGFNPIKESELSTLLYKFNKDKKNDYPFYFFNGKLLPTKLIQSENFTENNSKLNKLLQERNVLIQKEFSNWIKRLSPNSFVKIIKIILEKKNLGTLTAIKGFNQHYYVTKSIGLSKMKFVLQIIKESKPVTKYDIIEMRGMMPRFKVSNSIIVTSSFFKDSAIEESIIDTHSTIILIDKSFIIKKMIEFKIGLFEKKNGLTVIDHNFFLTLSN